MVDIFGKPLNDWRNPDLLMDDEFRRRMFQYFPKEMAVLDWPELRAKFAIHEGVAKAGKQSSRTLGTWAAILGGGGSAGVALGSLLNGPLQGGFIAISICAVTLGVFLAITHQVLPGRHKWLSSRLTAERLRAGYFHVTLDHFGLAARAISETALHNDWKILRAAKLEEMSHRLEEERKGAWIKWLDDGDLERTWMPSQTLLDLKKRSQLAIQAALVNPAEAQVLIDRLHVQRIEVQYSFSTRATVETLFTPSGRTKVLSILSMLTIAAVPMLGLLASVALLQGRSEDAKALIALGGAAAAIGLIFKLLDQGLSDHKDNQRYLDYKRRVEHVRKAFEKARRGEDLEGQIRTLFDLEHHAYWETRQFLLDHRTDNFL